MGLGAFLVCFDVLCVCCFGFCFVLFLFLLVFVLQKPLQLLCYPHTPFLDVLVPAACIDVSTTTTPLYSPLIHINLFFITLHTVRSVHSTKER